MTTPEKLRFLARMQYVPHPGQKFLFDAAAEMDRYNCLAVLICPLHTLEEVQVVKTCPICLWHIHQLACNQRDKLLRENEEINKALTIKLDAMPSGLSAGQSMKLEAEKNQLREMLATILPMAKGYAAEHDVGNNKAMVQEAEDLLRGARIVLCGPGGGSGFTGGAAIGGPGG